MKLFDKTMDSIQTALDVHYRRHAILTGNIANADTPNYKAREIDFAGELERAIGAPEELKKTDSRHMDVSHASASHVVFDNTGAIGADGNNVDLDIEVGKLSENARLYNAATNHLATKLRLLRLAASGRGG